MGRRQEPWDKGGRWAWGKQGRGGRFAGRRHRAIELTQVGGCPVQLWRWVSKQEVAEAAPVRRGIMWAGRREWGVCQSGAAGVARVRPGEAFASGGAASAEGSVAEWP